ncbi:MAG: metallophosphoesterase family protein, partial [Panacagrimonas sp.]
MSTVLQVSDLHFGTEVPSVVEALVRWTHEQSPDVLVLSGDISQRARRSQFEAARRFVDRLAVPRTLILPGNHDVPLFDLFSRTFRPYANYRASFGANQEPELDLPDLLVIGVDATRAWRHSDGELAPAQIERVAARLQRATPQQLRLVVTHQPLHVIRQRDAHNLTHGHAAAVNAWSAAGADIVMGGHIHLPYVSAVHEQLAHLPRPLWCVQAGTAVSSRIRPGVPNSVNLLCWNALLPDVSCTVGRWDYCFETQSFKLVE